MGSPYLQWSSYGAYLANINVDSWMRYPLINTVPISTMEYGTHLVEDSWMRYPLIKVHLGMGSPYLQMENGVDL